MRGITQHGYPVSYREPEALGTFENLLVSVIQNGAASQ